MPEDSPVSINGDIVDVPTCVSNGPVCDDDLNIEYTAAVGDAVHDTLMEVVDSVTAVTPIGAGGGNGSVDTDAAGLENTDAPPAFDALIL